MPLLRALPPLVVLSTTYLSATALLVEPFNYPDGEFQAVATGNWVVAVDNGNPNLMITDGRLQWDFTQGSATPVNSGWYGRLFSTANVDSGALYAHFDLTVDEAPALTGNEGGLFGGFWNGSAGNRARIWLGIGKDSEGNSIADTFRLGITESSGSRAGVAWDENNYPEGTTLRVVIKYDFGTDFAYLFVDAEDESTPVASNDDGGSYGLKGFAFRHKDDGDLGRFRVDNLAVSQAFEDISTGEAEPPSKLAARPVPGARILLTWRDNTNSETGFRVERKTGSGAFETFAQLGPNVNYAIDENPGVGVEYCYRVFALLPEDSIPTATVCAAASADQVVVLEPTLKVAATATSEPQLSLGSQRGVSYRLESSADLREWAPQGAPVGGIAGDLLVDLAPSEPATAAPRFYRVAGKRYEVPVDIGLSEPFQLPNNGGGATLDVTSYGATPDDPSDNDGTAIMSAISAAQPGDTVLIPAGTYHLRSGLVVKSGISLVGAGREATILLSDVPTLAVMIAISSGSADVTLADFTMDRLSGEMIDAVLIGTSSGTVVNRVWIKNLRIEHHQRRAVLVRQARHVKVENCRILNATNLGGGGNGYGVVFNDSNNNNNWVTGCIIGPVIRHGVLIQYEARNNLVEYNICFDTTEDAYDLHGEDESRNEVRFNLAYWNDPSGWDGTPVGIGVGNTGATHEDTGPYNWIHHNEVYGYYAGLEVIQDSHLQFVDGNYFHDNTVSGIRLNNGGGDGIMVRGNVLRDNGAFGIYAESSNALHAEDNIISGHGIGVSIAADSPGYRITGNDLMANDAALLLGTNDGVVEDNLK